MNDRDPAATKFWILQWIRFAAVGLVVLGAVIISGRLLDSPDFGYMLFVLGAMAFFLFPALLKQRWRSRDQ